MKSAQTAAEESATAGNDGDGEQSAVEYGTGPEGATGGGSSRSEHERDRLTVPQGLAALSLDALASVAYGPEAIVVVLAAAGSVGLGYTLR